MLFKKENIGLKADDQKEAENVKDSAFTSKYLNAQSLKVERLARDLTRLPDTSEIFFLQTIQAFNAFTFVQYIARLLYIEELWTTTYSVSMRTVEGLQELQAKGRIGKINLLISDSMQNRNPKVCDTINAWAKQNGNISVLYTWNHSKFTLIKTEGNFYGIEGSGNWGENACYEQYVIYNDETAFNLRKELWRDCKPVFKIN